MLQESLSAGDRVLVGKTLITVDPQFASHLAPGDTVLGIASTGSLKRIPADISEMVSGNVSQAVAAFEKLSAVSTTHINAFFDTAAQLLADDSIFQLIAVANDEDVANAQKRGRSVTRLRLTPHMRSDMISAFHMWRDAPMSQSQMVSEVQHDGWVVEEWRSALGVIGFVFEGRPNVFADATGVLKTGNSVVFRIGSDALATAKSIMSHVIQPSLEKSGLPTGSVVLIESPEHAAGWALFSDPRLSLAVARGSGEAVSELGAIAKQAGISVSLHGTGGAWILAGEHAQAEHLALFVENSLDRKVCNTVNVVCVPAIRAKELCEAVFTGAQNAAAKRGSQARLHSVNGAAQFLPTSHKIEVQRSHGVFSEDQISESQEEALGHEFEWEETPEFYLVIVDSLQHAVELFNMYSPQFIASTVSEDPAEIEFVWQQVNSPFFGDGFTRWVDGQFALLRPELGLSNWEHGRLFARSGILSGDSAFSVRLRVRQEDRNLHR